MIDILLIIFGILWVLQISFLIIYKIENRKKYDKMSQAEKNRIDIEAITKNIERDYKPLNIKLTGYEQEQEDNAIISYEELISNKDKNKANYDDTFVNKSKVDVKKVDLLDNVGTMVEETSLKVELLRYEKEEAFLKALKKLQNNLVR